MTEKRNDEVKEPPTTTFPISDPPVNPDNEEGEVPPVRDDRDVDVPTTE